MRPRHRRRHRARCAALAAHGHRVLAVEPTEALRAHGQRLHPSPRIEWLDDTLPGLAAVRARGARFDLILLTAVWMHLDAAERGEAMRHVARLLRPGGLVVISLRHGAVPPGRRMFDVSGDETCALADRHGLALAQRSEREDMLGRADIGWTFLALRSPGAGSSAPPRG